MKRTLIPDIVSDQILTIVSAETSICQAAQLMAQRRIGVVLVGTVDNLIGILSERDVTTRVVARGLDARMTTVGMAMTPEPMTITPQATAAAALALMHREGFRHVPVVEDNQVVGIVSIRDLYSAVQRELEEDLHERDSLMFGGGYSLSA